MSLGRRLSIVQQVLIENKNLSLNPTLKNFSDQELKDYIRELIEKEFKEHLITDVASAVKWYEHLYTTNAITKDEKAIHIELSKEYFNGKFN